MDFAESEDEEMNLKNCLTLALNFVLWLVFASVCWAQCANGNCPTCPGGACYRRPAAPVQVGQTVPSDALAIDSIDLIRKTVGSVSDKSRKKYDNFDDYVKSRRADAIAGKGFEALFALDFNEENSDLALLPTAVLGKPTDAADLALIDRGTNEIKGLYQCKLGVNAAVKAASDPKYKSFVIIVPSDVYERITKEPDAETIEYLDTGKIACSIEGFTADDRAEYEERAIDYLRTEFEQKNDQKGE